MCGGEIVDEKWKFSLEGVLRGTGYQRGGLYRERARFVSYQ